ncbi:DUF2383 domain-containing protein [Peptococcaceae bacterium 1198_IL3148]
MATIVLEVSVLDKQVDVLNKVLIGEHMAIDFYNMIIEKLDNEDLRQLLVQIQQQHEKHVLNLTQRIKDIGGSVEDDLGVKGMLAKSMFKLQTLGKLDELDALMTLYDGEDKGTASTENLMDQLDQENKKLVEENLSEDHDHLKILKTIISQMEGKNLH